MALDPLIGAISAGNVVVLKPSEQAPACSSFLAKTLPHYLDSNAIKVIEGGADVCEHLLLQKWDKIFFTGIIFYNMQCTYVYIEFNFSIGLNMFLVSALLLEIIGFSPSLFFV